MILLLKLFIAESLNAGVFNKQYMSDFKDNENPILPYSCNNFKRSIKTYSNVTLSIKMVNIVTCAVRKNF